MSAPRCNPSVRARHRLFECRLFGSFKTRLFDRLFESGKGLLTEQETGYDAYYVLVDDDGAILARLNLSGIDDGAAELGDRVAQRVASRGVATTAVRELCELAASEYGLRTLRARTTLDNIVCQKVLSKAGFNLVGDAEVGGRVGTWHERSLPHPDR